MKGITARALACLLLASGALACADRSDPLPGRPSFIIITLDTFRADRIAAYGGAPGLTPFLNGLAACSTVFANASTPIGATHPAHTSLFTGLYPGKHRVQRNGDHLDDGMETLAEVCKRRGYDTAAFVQVGALLDRTGLSRGFDATIEPGRFHSSIEVKEAARRWMDGRDPRRPFLLWIHYFTAHPPYGMTPYARALMGPHGGPFACGAPMSLYLAFSTPLLPVTGTNRAALGILYDGAAIETDSEVRDLLGMAAAYRLLPQAVTIVTADHGTLLGEHGCRGYGEELWQEAVHVPLFIRVPGQRTSRRVETRVSLVDVLPTVLEWLDIQPMRAPDGRSLLAALHGKPLGPVVTLCSTPPPPPGGGADRDRVAAFFQDHKVIVDADAIQLFDLMRDPGERAPEPLQSVPRATRDLLIAMARAHQGRERPARPVIE